jgi:hypothetical protein
LAILRLIGQPLTAGAYYAALGINFALILVLACCRKTTQVVPWNYMLLGAFTLAESYLVGTISSFYDTNAVLLAFGICIGITIALTVFAFQTKIDFSAFRIGRAASRAQVAPSPTRPPQCPVPLGEWKSRCRTRGPVVLCVLLRCHHTSLCRRYKPSSLGSVASCSHTADAQVVARRWAPAAIRIR